MAKKVYVRFGHEVLTNGNNTAAPAKILNEYNVITEYAAYVADYLYRSGYQVMTGGQSYKKYSTAYDALIGEVDKAKAWGADFFVSLHANVGGGTGPEVFTHTTDSIGKSASANICANLSRTLGLTNRGVKNGDDYVECYYAPMPAVIVEPFFTDNATDCNAYNRVGKAAVGLAIADGIKATIK